MTSNRRLHRAGMTLLEIMIAYVILGILILAAVAAILAASRPINDTSIRSEAVTQGNQVLARVSRDLESGYNLEVGVLTGTVTFNADTSDDDPGPDEVFTGRAIKYQTATSWDTANDEPILDPPEPLTTNPHILAFKTDPDPRIAGSLMLVHILPGGQEVTLRKDIENGTVGIHPPPHFRLTTPSQLEIVFTVIRQVDYNRDLNVPVYARIEFRETVNLRNLNQY